MGPNGGAALLRKKNKVCRIFIKEEIISCSLSMKVNSAEGNSMCSVLDGEMAHMFGEWQASLTIDAV